MTTTSFSSDAEAKPLVSEKLYLKTLPFNEFERFLDSTYAFLLARLAIAIFQSTFSPINRLNCWVFGLTRTAPFIYLFIENFSCLHSSRLNFFVRIITFKSLNFPQKIQILTLFMYVFFSVCC